MSWFDVCALVVVLLAVLDGVTSGFLWALLEFLTVVFAAAAARALRPFAQPYVAKIAGISESELPWLTHLLVFAACGCVLFGLLVLIHPGKKKQERSKSSRWAGGILGVATGGLAALLLVAVVIGSHAPAWEEQARLSRLLDVVAHVADGPGAALLPDHAGPRAAELAASR